MVGVAEGALDWITISGWTGPSLSTGAGFSFGGAFGPGKVVFIGLSGGCEPSLSTGAGCSFGGAFGAGKVAFTGLSGALSTGTGFIGGSLSSSGPGLALFDNDRVLNDTETTSDAVEELAA